SYLEELVVDTLKRKDITDAACELSRIASEYPGSGNAWLEFLREFEMINEYLLDLDHPDRVRSGILRYYIQEKRLLYRRSVPRSFGGVDGEKLKECKNKLRDEFRKVVDAVEKQEGNDLDLVYEISLDLLKIYSRFSRSMASRKESMNVVDFTDMISTVYRFFRDEKELVREHFSGRFRYVMLDEFQDTDPSQWSIILDLVGEIADGNDRLFIVGDPKQSIYRFRKADVTLFKKARRMIVDDLKGNNIDLDINFRSTPAVMDFANYLFMDILVDNGKEWEFEYEPLKVSDQRKGDVGSVEFLLGESRDLKGVELVLERAMLVAARISEIVREGKMKIFWDERGEHLDVPRDPEYGDITILFRVKTHLKLYEHAFREFGIPYHVHGGMGFYRKQEVVDLYNILSFLDNPTDEL
ncbi:MAG: UvrD-helicase domain-containing protein, partial [Candidatus Thermoplasmatota archaeon]|nr:UvrD-helicase domain-containing protein [Candidatus Thermoplasmatota archaeon]